MNEMREQINYLQSIVIEQRELAKASEAKGEFLKEELKTLHLDDHCLDKCIETLKKSLEELYVEIVSLTERIITLSAHESVLNFKWEKERIFEQVAQQKE